MVRGAPPPPLPGAATLSEGFRDSALQDATSSVVKGDEKLRVGQDVLRAASVRGTR